MVWITCIWLVCDVVEGAGAAGRRVESVGVGVVWMNNICSVGDIMYQVCM